MCFYFINRTISNINGELFLNNVTIDKLKRTSNILIIDDDTFTYLETLRRHEFNIEYKRDIDSIKDVEAYDIILCDIRGVGKFLESEFEGAYLVKQIKEKYPNKILVSYTANNYDVKFQKYLQYADATIPKGSPIEAWSALLEDLLKKEADPVSQWLRTRDALLKANVPTIDVAQIESRYVKAIQNKSFESMEKLYKKKSSEEAEIVKSLLKSIIAKIIRGNL